MVTSGPLRERIDDVEKRLQSALDADVRMHEDQLRTVGWFLAVAAAGLGIVLSARSPEGGLSHIAWLVRAGVAASFVHALFLGRRFHRDVLDFFWWARSMQAKIELCRRRALDALDEDSLELTHGALDGRLRAGEWLKEHDRLELTEAHDKCLRLTSSCKDLERRTSRWTFWTMAAGAAFLVFTSCP